MFCSHDRLLMDSNLLVLFSCMCKCYAICRVGLDCCSMSARRYVHALCSHKLEKTLDLAQALLYGALRPGGGVRCRSLTTHVFP